MENKYLFENETLIAVSNDKTITLTSRRIRQVMGKEYTASIHLEKISAIEIQSKSFPLVVALGGTMVAVGALFLIQNNNNDRFIGVLGLTVGAIFILLYLFTRYHIISITSDGGTKINSRTAGMKREAVLDFVNKIETAKSLIN